LANPLRLRYGRSVTEASSFLNPIRSLPGIRAAWIPRLADVPVADADRDEAMRRLRPYHEKAVLEFGGTLATWWRAEQIHGTEVAAVPDAPTLLASDGLPVVPGVDGLITCTPGIVLSIYVADCGAIWLADKKTGAIGLLHSGKKGSEGNIFQGAIEKMKALYGTNPSDVVAVLGPCIRPPHYEVNFAAEIGLQAASIGIASFTDCGENTASDLDLHYSYRMEMGKTGRMMALLTRDPSA
jgi:copper oxidase (laccase) domain-containing protein